MLKEYCKIKAKIIDNALSQFIPLENYPQVIFEAMRYSLFAGGKRLRPILLMAAADAVGGKGENFIHTACGLEMIHTYSLIHDDLPSMDNDDYRRGKLTNHKVYGEGIAILAGDALLTTAFEVMLNQPDAEAGVLLQVVREIAVAAGAKGMIGGQVIDLSSEGKAIDIQTLQYMHQAKTGALFKAAICSGARLAGATEKQITDLGIYAEKFGLAFQITDDILDVTGNQDTLGKPVGSDVRNSKSTYVSLYSLDMAKLMAKEAVEAALQAIDDLGNEANVLRDMASYLLLRDN